MVGVVSLSEDNAPRINLNLLVRQLWRVIMSEGSHRAFPWIFGRFSWRRGFKRPLLRKSIRVQIEELEDRLTPSATSYDVYALTLINEMRGNPAAFGQELKNLYANPSYVAPDGMSGNTAVWKDIRQDINQSEKTSSWRSGFNGPGSNTFLSVITALPRTRPLVIENLVEGVNFQQGADNHVSWMATNGYMAHSLLGSNPLDLSTPIPGFAQVKNPTPDLFQPNISRGREHCGGDGGWPVLPAGCVSGHHRLHAREPQRQHGPEPRLGASL
jgi:hypothetical protein